MNKSASSTYTDPDGIIPLLQKTRKSPLRIYWAAGTGNVVGTLKHFGQGIDDPSIVAIGYSHVFYEICQSLGAKALADCTHIGLGEAQVGDLRARSKPFYSWAQRGVLYHLGLVLYTLARILSAVRFRADVFLCTTGVSYPTLVLLRLFRIPVVVSLHTTLWPRATEPTGRFLREKRQCGWAWKHAIQASMCVSPEIREQLLASSEGKPWAPIAIQTPQYRIGVLKPTEPPPIDPFKVMFAGRITVTKGVFMLVEAAQVLEKELPNRFEWHFCGDGPALNDLRKAVAESGVAHRIHLHGALDKPEMARRIERSHVLMTPTTTGFNEGLAKVPVEAVLAGRPAIISSAVPAADILGGAVAEFPADNLDAMIAVIKKMATNPEVYEEMIGHCQAVSDQFYDRSKSWGSTFLPLLRRVLVEKPKRGKA